MSSNNLRIMNEYIEGIGPWLWMKDSQSYEIVKQDWINHHRHKWFKHVKSNNVVLQAGGFCGMYPRLLSNKFKHVYTFEPDPMSFHCLVNNCQYDNIIKINAALGNKTGHTGLYRIPNNLGMNKVNPDTGDSILLMMKIDDLQLRDLNLLALDLEEYEIEALKGGIKTIKKFKPTIIVENGSLVEEFLKNIGYDLVDQSGNDSIFTSNK